MSRSLRYDPDDEPAHAPPVNRCGQTHKVCFASHERAVARIMEFANPPPIMRAYQCSFCGLRRLTSKPEL